MTISYDTFSQVDIRSGTIIQADPFERAKKPAYKIWVDFGEELGIKRTSAQVTQHYQTSDLIGKQVLGCINLGKKNIAGFLSEFLILGFADSEGHIVLATPAQSIPNGARLI